MLRSYRHFVLALVGCLSLSAPAPSQSTQTNKAQAQNTSDGELSRVAAAIEKLPKAQAPDHGCQGRQDDRASDLCAQWKAADAAAESARWTYWTLWAGVIGLGIGAGTLAAAVFAALYAKDAATAAHDGLDHAKEASRADLRPWLDMKTSGDMLILNERQCVIQFEMEVTNIGKTPAVDVHREAKLFNFGPETESQIPDFFASSFIPWPGSRPRAILPQGKIEMNGSAHMLRDSINLIDTLGSHYVMLILVVRIVYRWGSDGFGQTFRTFGVHRTRSETSPQWLPVEVFPAAETRQRIHVRPERFDHIE